MPCATEHFLWGIRSRRPFTPLCDPGIARDAVAIVDAGRESAAPEFRLVRVDSRSDG